MAQILLDSPDVYAIINQLIPTPMPQHMGMYGEIEARVLPCPGDQLPYRGRGQWILTFGREHIDPTVVAFEFSQRAYFNPSQGMGAGRAILGPIDV